MLLLQLLIARVLVLLIYLYNYISSSTI